MKRHLHSQQFVIVDSTGFWGRPAASFLLVLIAIVLMSLSVFRPYIVEDARTHVSDAVSPLLAMVAKPVQAITTTIREVSGLAGIQAEMAALKKENQRLKGWHKAAMFLKEENKSLRDLLNIQVDVPHSFVTARVISDTQSSYMNSQLVTAGNNAGVQKGQAVLSAEGLIGRIIESGQETSRVLLVTDMNSRIPVLIEGYKHFAILAGTNEPRPVLQHLPEKNLPKSGAAVFTSGHGGVFPPGLPVGRIVEVQGSEPVVQLYSDLESVLYARIVNTDIDVNLRTGAL